MTVKLDPRTQLIWIVEPAKAADDHNFAIVDAWSGKTLKGDLGSLAMAMCALLDLAATHKRTVTSMTERNGAIIVLVENRGGHVDESPL